MIERSWMQFLASLSDNLKSKTCIAFDKPRPRTCRVEPRRSIQNQKWVGIVAVVLTFVFGGAAAQAQQPGKVPQIGFLGGNREGPSVREFQQGLRDLDYVEGKNILLDYRAPGRKHHGRYNAHPRLKWKAAGIA